MGKKDKLKGRSKNRFLPITDTLDHAFFEMDKYHVEGRAQIDLHSGYEFLNKLFIHSKRPRFSIVSVPTGIGGSSYLAGSIITELAIRFKRTIGILSMQVSSPHFSMIMLSIVSNADHYLIRTGRLPSEQWPDLSRAAVQITDANIYIDGTRSHSIKSILKSAHQMMQESKLDLLVMDNLQFISRERKQGRQAHEYQQICHSLRDLSEDLEVSILLMSEFSDEYDTDDIRIVSNCLDFEPLQSYTRIADAELCLVPGESVEEGRLFNLHLYENYDGVTGTINLTRNNSGGGFKESLDTEV